MDDEYYLVGFVRRNSVEEVRVALKESRGEAFIDVRLFVDVFGGRPENRQPTRKGISLRTRALPDLINLLKRAEAEARRRGLIGGDGGGTRG